MNDENSVQWEAAQDEPTQEWQKEAMERHNAAIIINSQGWNIWYKKNNTLGEHTWENNMQAWEWLHTNGNQRRTLMS